MKPLRIVRVLPFYGPRFGGPVAQAHAVHRELRARGHAVAVVSTDLDRPDAVADAWFDEQGVRTFLAHARGLATMPPYVPPRSAAAALRTALADADVATVNVGLSRWGNLLAKQCAAARVPFVYNAEGALDPVRLAVKGWQKRWFLALCERATLRAAAAVQAVTPAEAGHVQALGVAAAKVAVVPNGIALPPLPDAAARARGRALLQVPEAARLVLFLGRLHALKGLDRLLAAMAPALLQRTDLHLAIVGPDDGALADVQARLRTLPAAARVHCHGAVHGSHHGDVLAAADVFALLSHSEGLPNAALEAAAAGLPLWLTPACNLPEVTEYRAGVVAEPDAAAQQRALATLLADVDGPRELGKNARAMAAAKFSISSVVDRLEALWRAVSCRR